MTILRATFLIISLVLLGSSARAAEGPAGGGGAAACSWPREAAWKQREGLSPTLCARYSRLREFSRTCAEAQANLKKLDQELKTVREEVGSAVKHMKFPQVNALQGAMCEQAKILNSAAAGHYKHLQQFWNSRARSRMFAVLAALDESVVGAMDAERRRATDAGKHLHCWFEGLSRGPQGTEAQEAELDARQADAERLYSANQCSFPFQEISKH